MTCFASYLRKSYHLSAILPFMLYMPDSTQFMQEMTSKDQKKEAPEPRSVHLSEPVTESNRSVRLQARFQFAHEERSVRLSDLWFA